MAILQDTELLKISYLKGKDPFVGKFILEPFLPGFGLTIGHALRRVLLSSLEGAAISSVKIDGVTHEFSTLKGVKEDVIEIILNLKSTRFKMFDNDPVTIKLSKKGPGVIKAKDFNKNSAIEIIDPEQHIATLDKSGKLSLEAIIKKGRGYEPVEKRKDEKLALGTIAVDSIYTPVKKIHYDVENTRVGGMTNYDKVILDITTDGSILPEDAMKTANKILIEHFNLIAEKLTSNDKKIDNKTQPELTESKTEIKSKKKVENSSKSKKAISKKKVK